MKIPSASKPFAPLVCSDGMERKTKYSIAITTSLLLVYAICVVLPVWYGIIFSLFMITSIGLLWMIYNILTDTTSLTNRTFERYYYEDVDYLQGEGKDEPLN